MSFSEGKLKDKLDALEETQDSIVSTSQWVLFHYRYADRIAPEWETYLNKSPVQKKLAVIYLANDVVQQSRAKRKTEFIDAFNKLLPRALSQAYSEVPEPTKKKISKIVNIWRERKIFPHPVELHTGETINGSASAAEDDSNLSFEDKLKSIGSSSKKFQRFYHELLLGSNGSFKSQDIKTLNALKKAINENIIQLQDLTETIEDEISHIGEREKFTEEKRLEVEQKQKELEKQRQQEEEERIAEEKRRVEEESMLPTYDDGSDSNSDDNDSSTDEEKGEEKNEEKEEESAEEKSQTKQDLKDQPPVKKLRFAD